MRKRRVSRLRENKANFEDPNTRLRQGGYRGRESGRLLQGCSRGIVGRSWDMYGITG